MIGLVNILGGLLFISSKKDAAASFVMTGDSLTVSPESNPPAALLDLDLGESSSANDLPGLPSPLNLQSPDPTQAPTQAGQGGGSVTSNSGGAPAPTTAPILNLPVPTLAILPGATQTPAPSATPGPAATQTLVAPAATATAAAQQSSGDTIIATDYERLSEALAALEEGQTLIVPAGEYPLKGPVYLPGDVELYFESGSLVRFLGSDDGFVFQDVSNVTVEGMRSYHESTTTTGRNIRTLNASNITFIDTVIERSGSIGISIDESNDIVIDGYVNTDQAVHPGNVDDALNIRNSHDVRVRNFDLWVADDAISLKTMGKLNGETYNITIENGVVRSRDSGIAFGSEIDEDIYNITIRNVDFVDSGNPIYFKRYDETYSGSIENIRIENISVRGSGIQRFFFIHGKSGTANTVRNVTLRNSDFQGDTEFQDFYFQHNDPETNDIVFENVTANGEPVQP